jgi:hypothetical protein
MTVGPSKWKPEGIASVDLVRGYRAARELQRLPVPPHLDKKYLGKKLAGYIMRAGTELIARENDLDAIGARQMAGTTNDMAGNDIVDAASSTCFSRSSTKPSRKTSPSR